jgi:hypothetical protein
MGKYMFDFLAYKITTLKKEKGRGGGICREKIYSVRTNWQIETFM